MGMPPTLVDRVVAFGRALRTAGVRVNTASLLTALQALTVVDITDREAFYYALLAALTAGPHEQALFDGVFAQHWGLTLDDGVGGGATVPGAAVARDSAAPEAVDAAPGPGSELPGQPKDGGEANGGEAADSDPDDRRDPGTAAADRAASPDLPGPGAGGEPEAVAGGQRGGASLTEVAAVRVIQPITPAELARLRQVVARLLGRLQYLPVTSGHRRQPGSSLDLRRSLRRSMRQGGDLLQLQFRSKAPGRINVVAMLDISGSMDSHTEFLLQFLYALQGASRNVESFVFSTRLSRITPWLRRGYGAARVEVARRVRHWSGGTRQGDCLREFNDRWGQACSGASTCVLIISDGWDRGDPDLLARELARLRGSARRLIWLNPLLGVPGYQPLARGLKIASQYVDHFFPARDTGSLLRVVNLIAEP